MLFVQLRIANGHSTASKFLAREGEVEVSSEKQIEPELPASERNDH